MVSKKSKKPKHDFTKSMKNVSYYQEREKDKNSYFRQMELEIEIDASDKLRLERFFKEETGYYNHLVSGFSSYVRAFANDIIEFDDAWTKIFSYVAESSYYLQLYIGNKVNTNFPVELQQYKDFLTPNNERKMMIANLAAGPGTLLPIVRRNMASEILKFYKEQALRILTPAQPSKVDDGDTYKIAPEMLEVVDVSRKRHLQIPRDGLIVSWDATKQATNLRVAYAAKPIYVPKLNLEELRSWNYVVIHQMPGKYVDPMTPWIIDVKKLDEKYMLNYLDIKRPYRSAMFDMNRRRD